MTGSRRVRFEIGQQVEVLSWGLSGKIVEIRNNLGTIYLVDTKREGVIPCRDKELLPLFDETISKGEKLSERK